MHMLLLVGTQQQIALLTMAKVSTVSVGASGRSALVSSMQLVASCSSNMLQLLACT